MTRYLLDTHVFLWMMLDNSAIPKRVHSLCEEAESLYLSSVSAWEITMKYALKKLPLPKPPSVLLPEARALEQVESLDFTEADAFHVARLPFVHKDPFDRMLVCQAIQHGLPIVTNDRCIAAYPVRTLW